MDFDIPDTPKTEAGTTEKLYEGISMIFEKLNKRFIDYEKESDNSQGTLDYISKLAGTIGYIAQVHTSIAKAYKHEKRLNEIEKRISNLSPEVFKQVKDLK